VIFSNRDAGVSAKAHAVKLARRNALRLATGVQSMIPKSGYRFSDKIMLKQRF
jgi:hypothetical protein